MLQRLLPWNYLLPCLLLGACAAYGPPEAVVGLSRQAVLARLGQPELERRLNEGSRLEFPRGPYGKHTWFVYLDAHDRVSRAEQVLTEQNFARVDVGMSQDALRQLLGRPNQVQLLGRARGVVWSYRYENNFCLWFQVELSLQQQVRSAGFGEPPECERPNDRDK